MNCRKKEYYAWNCYLRTFRKKPEDEKTTERANWARCIWNQATKKAAATWLANQDYDNSDPKSYSVGRVFMMKDIDDKVNDTWYLDSCALGYICNNRDLFSDMCTKNYKFITSGGEIIWSQEVGMVHFLLQTDTTMILFNVSYTLKCDSNLISLS